MTDFTLDDLAELAGEKSYRRGLGYIDAVRRLSADDAEIHAQVIGTGRYRVRLWIDGEGVTGSCDCPWGEEGNFCKHCVAVGVVYLYEREHGEEIAAPVDLRSHLESLDHAALVDLLLEAAERDERLFERLDLGAGFSRARGGSVDKLTAAVDDALVLNANYYLDFDDHQVYADTVAGFASQALALVADGRAADAVALSAHAIDRVRQNWERAEHEYQVGEAAAELAAAHRDACTAARPDPIALAEWLIAHQLDDNTVPELLIGDYAPVLGEAGLRRYGALLDARKGDSWTYRFLKTEYARASGDDEQLLVALAEGGDGWQVIEQLDRMDRRGEAVERAEASLMPGRIDQRVVDFLDEHHRIEDDRAALIALHRKRFECDPGRHSYEALAALDEPGLLAWAVDSVRGDLEGGTRHWGLADLMAWMLLDQDRVAEAWAAANRYRALPEVRIEVAKHHRHTDPEACGELFMTRADALIEQRNKHSYEDAAALVALAAECLDESGGPGTGETYVAELRAAHRRKRNLMAALDAHGLR
ncbi:SWIM zinc finger family protein [Glycomyces arizonensis]|uniref:SWIM zinc finger family protein n=1 Tax=Glycomyces arizonensis TaxID=256035 RepID=UPI0003FE6275|nr:SWIM zinc finger family protein [Glycomyces arizonensis]